MLLCGQRSIQKQGHSNSTTLTETCNRQGRGYKGRGPDELLGYLDPKELGRPFQTLQVHGPEKARNILSCSSEATCSKLTQSQSLSLS